eukprot:546263-Rhodomonas_salina.6
MGMEAALFSSRSQHPNRAVSRRSLAAQKWVSGCRDTGRLDSGSWFLCLLCERRVTSGFTVNPSHARPPLPQGRC